MEKRPCRLLIVDDSASYRNQIRLALDGLEGITVGGMASDGQLALEALSAREYDLMITDLEMPNMDGLSLLKEMKTRKIRTKVLVFSSFSSRGARITMEALALGALDFVLKPTASEAGQKPSELIREGILPKIKAMLSAPTPNAPAAKPVSRVNWHFFDPGVLVIASSTGGPKALEEFFSHISQAPSCPVLIAQHMPPMFTLYLAESIQKRTGLVCKEGRDGEVIKKGQIYIAPGNFHMRLERVSDESVIRLDQGPLRNSVRPCADYLFESAAAIYGRSTLGVVFTGMGVDGKDGSGAIKNTKGAIITQSESSCVVYGMPKAVDELGLSDKSGSPAEIGNFINSLISRRKVS